MKDCKATSLALELAVGESIVVDGGTIKIELDHKSGHKARLVFTANQDVRFELQRESKAVTA